MGSLAETWQVSRNDGGIGERGEGGEKHISKFDHDRCIFILFKGLT